MALVIRVKKRGSFVFRKVSDLQGDSQLSDFTSGTIFLQLRDNTGVLQTESNLNDTVTFQNVPDGNYQINVTIAPFYIQTVAFNVVVTNNVFNIPVFDLGHVILQRQFSLIVETDGTGLNELIVQLKNSFNSTILNYSVSKVLFTNIFVVSFNFFISAFDTSFKLLMRQNYERTLDTPIGNFTELNLNLTNINNKVIRINLIPE